MYLLPTYSHHSAGVLGFFLAALPASLLTGWLAACRSFQNVLAPAHAHADEGERIQLLDRALAIASEGVVIIRNGIIVSVNEACVSITGYSREDAIGKPPSLLFSAEHEQQVHERRSALRARGSWQGEIWGRRRNGEVYPAWTAITRLERDGNRYFVSVFSDESAAKRNVARLEYLTHHDVLTDLPNRALFCQRLSEMVVRADRRRCLVGVLFVDIDHFKLVNDSLGHGAGDEILRRVGERLKARVRAGDTVARFGGDEFAILLDEIHSSDEALTIAEKVLSAFADAVAVRGHSIFLTASLGISCYPGDGNDAGELIKNAHAAMYRAKDEGRNTCRLFAREMNAHARRKLSLRNGLREAIGRGELRLEYQPRVCLRTGAVLGVEALVRWQHSEHGLMLPGSFIDLAEETGLIEPLGDWVLESACRQFRKWRDTGSNLAFVSVNLSPRQFRQDALREKICAVLDTTGVPPNALELEITEGVVMDNPAAASTVLDELAATGICLSLDDFGTGYSSLAYLKRFPIRHLKIDRSFVEELPGDEEAAAITRAILALAKSLRISVTAEGIETLEQAQFLRNEGCECGQGYLFGRPAAPRYWNDLEACRGGYLER